MKTRILCLLFIFGFFISACDAILALPQPPGIASGPSAVDLVSPLDGQHFSLGDLIEVQSEISGAENPLTVTLIVDGAPHRVDAFEDSYTSAEIYQPWLPAAPGEYKLKTLMGGETFSSEITVYIDPPRAEEIDKEPEDETTEAVDPDCPVPSATSTGYPTAGQVRELPTRCHHLKTGANLPHHQRQRIANLVGN